METVFDLRNVSFTYQEGRQKALEKISFKVAPGERLAILGANGSGKSTLLKLLDGLLFPDSGAFYGFGHEITEEKMQQEVFVFAFRRKVGFVFQNSEIQLFCPTVWDEAAFAPLQLGLPKEEVATRVEQVLNLLGILPLADRPTYRLSGGEKKKVALASVLSVNPQVLLFDEPTNGLDPKTQEWLLDLLLQFGDIGKTQIISTHQLDLVARFAQRVLVLNEEHRIVADGSPQEILSDRQLLDEANLIGKNYLPPL